MQSPEVADLPEITGLPDVLLCADSSPVRSAAEWPERRAEIVEILQHYAYGHMPAGRPPVVVERDSECRALGGAARQTSAVLRLGPRQQLRLRLSLFTPAPGDGPFPVIMVTGPVNGSENEAVAQALVKRGYALAGYERHDLDADDADRSDGLHPLYPDCDWATLAVWAWGAIRSIDYLMTREDIDPEQITLTGHSRGGKTALLAAALDTRIALAAPHASGAGGAGCWRIEGEGSETLAVITDPKRFHYWFHERLGTFAGHEARLPFDQHFLKALVAPRALLCVEALDDLWANPLGTQRSSEAAQPVFDLLGAGDRIAYWCRPGGHDMQLQDWLAIVDYADYVLRGKSSTRDWRSLPFGPSRA
jgi:hypothetical protein